MRLKAERRRERTLPQRPVPRPLPPQALSPPPQAPQSEPPTPEPPRPLEQIRPLLPPQLQIRQTRPASPRRALCRSNIHDGDVVGRQLNAVTASVSHEEALDLQRQAQRLRAAAMIDHDPYSLAGP